MPALSLAQQVLNVDADLFEDLVSKDLKWLQALEKQIKIRKALIVAGRAADLDGKPAQPAPPEFKAALAETLRHSSRPATRNVADALECGDAAGLPLDPRDPGAMAKRLSNEAPSPEKAAVERDIARAVAPLTSEAAITADVVEAQHLLDASVAHFPALGLNGFTVPRGGTVGLVAQDPVHGGGLPSNEALGLDENGHPRDPAKWLGTEPDWVARIHRAQEKYPDRWRATLVRVGTLTRGPMAPSAQRVATAVLVAASRVVSNAHVFDSEPLVKNGESLYWTPACEVTQGALRCGSAPSIKLARVLPERCSQAGGLNAVVSDCRTGILASPANWAAIAAAQGGPDASGPAATTFLVVGAPITSRLERCGVPALCGAQYDCLQGYQNTWWDAHADKCKLGEDVCLSFCFKIVCPSGAISPQKFCPEETQACRCSSPSFAGALCYLGATAPGNSGSLVVDIDTFRPIGMHAGGDLVSYAFNYGLPVTALAPP